MLEMGPIVFVLLCNLRLLPTCNFCPCCCVVEAEFRAYHLLSLMGQHGKFKGDQQAFLSMLQVHHVAFSLHSLPKLHGHSVKMQLPDCRAWPARAAWPAVKICRALFTSCSGLLQGMRPEVRDAPPIQWVLKLQVSLGMA